MKNIFVFLIVTVFFYIVAIFQSSFLPHIFPVPHVVFIPFFLVIFFQNQARKWWGMAYAVVAGLCIDLFSMAGNSVFIGPGIIACLAAWITIISLDYFLQEREDSYLIVYFFIVFALSLAAYLLVIFGINYLL